MDRTTRTLGHVKKGRDTFTMERPNISSMNEGEERTTMVNGVLTTYRKQQNQLWLNEWTKQGGIISDSTLDATLTALAGLTIGANELIYGTGTDAFSMLAVNATATNKFLRQISSGAPSWEALTRSDLTQETTVPYQIPISDFRWNDGSIPTTTAANGNPKIYMGGHTNGWGYFRGVDAQTTQSNDKLFFDFPLPECYISAGAITVSFSAYFQDYGTNTENPKTIDCTAYEIEEAGTAGGDLCATAAQTYTDSTVSYVFTITSTNLIAGDLLRIYVITSLMGSTGGALYSNIMGATIKLSIKG